MVARDGDTNNNQNGEVNGPVVQAGTIQGPVTINSQRPAGEHWPVDGRAFHAPDLFVARTKELALLDTIGVAQDDNTPPDVVFVCGPPGVGKTALALRWACDPARTERYPDGVIVLEMRGYSGEQPIRELGALKQLRAQLGSDGPERGDGPEAALEFKSILADRKVIIVLDDVADADLIRELLPARGGALIIITRRGGPPGQFTTPGVRQVHTLRLTRMQPPDAMNLLKAAIGDPRDFDEESARAVLDYACGLPIALCIVASLVSNDELGMTLASLERELSGRQTALKVFDAWVSSEGRLERIFETSYEKLDDDARRLFRLLAEHVGRPVTVYSAALVAGTDLLEAARLLLKLVNVGLLETDAPSFAMLDLARDYGRALAKADDAGVHRATVNRLLDGYYLAVNHAFDVVNKRNPMADTRALDAWPARDETSWHIGRNDAEVSQWLESQYLNLVALVRAGCAASPPHAGAARLAFSLFYLLERGGYWTSWSEITARGLQVAKATGDRRTYALLLRNQARIGMVRLRNLADSIRTEVSDEAVRARARSDCIGVTRAFKRSRRMAAHLGPELALTLAREIADTKLLLARLDQSTTSLRRAEKAYRAVEKKLCALPDNENPIASLSVPLSEVHRCQGRFDEAQKRLDTALSYAWPIGENGTRTVRHAGTCGYALVRQTELYIAQRDVKAALDAIGSAIEVFRDHGMAIPEARALALAADLCVSTGDQRGAADALERSYEILRDKSSPEAAVVRQRLDVVRGSGPIPPASNGSDTW
ncbi:NB-ARC domain-containing protein [Kutzneria chonburiensis]|uniref:NB-ARC domain-containing protein n=1 Tax=Kutzneria chonburiensis TaxID=1483604 RepID=A0ABV6MWP0_9PSEU|nr:NB-ARC domain-containing protein [Kutzneria chonburiensis]